MSLTLESEIGFYSYPADQPPLVPPVGQATVEVLRAAAQDRDPKAVADAIPPNAWGMLERLASAAIGGGGLDAYRTVARDASPYSGRIWTTPDGMSMDEAAFDLRRAQEVTIDGQSIGMRRTCDGRYESQGYQHDLGEVFDGLLATGDVSKGLNILNFLTREINIHGYPFNAVPYTENERMQPNYTAGRSQRPDYFYMVDAAAQHLGDEIYREFREPMLRYWKFWNPTIDIESFARGPEAIRGDGHYHAHRRGIISPEGWPVSRYWDDTNNGRPYEQYLPRLEMAKNDLETAEEAAERFAPEDRRRIKAKTLLGLMISAESIMDHSLGRFARGSSPEMDPRINLSHMYHAVDTIPLDLNCTLADAERMLAYSYRLERDKLEKAGRFTEASTAYTYELAFTTISNLRSQFIWERMRDPETGVPADLEMIGGPGTFTEARPIRTLSAVAMNTLYSGISGYGNVLEDEMSVLNTKRQIDKHLAGPGGIAVTDLVNVDVPQQWDANSWSTVEKRAITGAVKAAARLTSRLGFRGATIDELLQFAKDRQIAALHGRQVRFDKRGRFAEKVNAQHPHEEPIDGEYTSVAENGEGNENFAMTAEWVLWANRYNVEDAYHRELERLSHQSAHN